MIVYTDRASLSKWDERFLALAEQVAAWSKGPRKRIGAVIVRPDWRASAEEAERIFINAGVECLFMFEGA